MVHSTYGDCEGVSIVMKQIEDSLVESGKVKRKNIFYLTGNYAGKKSGRVFVEKSFWFNYDLNLLVHKEKYEKGLSSDEIVFLERAIAKGVRSIRSFVDNNAIEVLISHNSCYPTNFVMAMSLSRYFDEEKKMGRRIPKHIVWWHDSHLERKAFLNPAKNIKKYLIEGVPGKNVDHICFINSTQYKAARKYFVEVDKIYPGVLKKMEKNHSVVYNTTELFIDDFFDLQKRFVKKKVKRFLKDFSVVDFLKSRKVDFSKTLFCLQGTRIVRRKRIDFALEYLYSLLSKLKKEGLYDAMYFMVSGHNADFSRKELECLNEELSKKYKETNFFLIFAEDYYEKTRLTFFDYPLVFAGLDGISTYFSEVEGFGNNLLEVMASGLPVVVYEYPIFKSDIKKFGFDLVRLEEYVLSRKSFDLVVDVLKDPFKREEIVNHNLKVLKENLGHDLICRKIFDAVF